MNAFELAKKDNGSVVIDGTEYALAQEAFISDNGDTYEAQGFSRDMMNDDGEHQSGLDDTVTILWDVICDDTQGDDSNACDWNAARI